MNAQAERWDWFFTFTGRKVYVHDPDPNEIVIEDIAHALSNLCRFGGHTRRFYSVAEHSVLVSRLVSRRGQPGNSYIKRALLHDASEAYLGDVIRPLKTSLHEYKAIELKWEAAIAVRFELPADEDGDRVVKAADMQALLIERAALGNEAWMSATWKEDEQGHQMPIKSDGVIGNYPGVAKDIFLAHWREAR